MRKLSYILVIIGCLIVTNSARAAIAFVQATSSGQPVLGGCAAAGCAQTFLSNVTAGSLIVTWSTWGNSTLQATTTDSAGDVFTCAMFRNDPVNTQSSNMCFALNVAGGATTVSTTFQNGTFQALTIAEFSGVATTNALDTSSTNQVALAGATTAIDGVTAPSSTNIVSTNQADLVVGAVIDSNGAQATVSAGTGQTEIINPPNITGGVPYEMEYYIQSASGRASSTWTFSLANEYVATMGAFKAAPAAATPNPFQGQARNIIRSSFIARSSCIFR